MVEFRNGRRKATIVERAGKFVVKFFISDEGQDDEDVGGTLAFSLASANSRCAAWTERGVLP